MRSYRHYKVTPTGEKIVMASFVAIGAISVLFPPLGLAILGKILARKAGEHVAKKMGI